MSEKLRKAHLPGTKRLPKSKKLGLLTVRHRRDITFRFHHNTIERLQELVELYRSKLSFKLSRTDIIEACVLWATQQTNETIKKTIMDWQKRVEKEKNDN